MPDVAKLDKMLVKLQKAVAAERSENYCLRLWSNFIRYRDDQMCVICGDSDKLNAHHIFRKCFLKETKFQTGNGISLCGECHRQPHEVFNQQANLDLPMDAEGGENIELTVDFLEYLIKSATQRELLSDDYYYFSDHALSTFKAAQSIDPHLPFPGLRIEQALLIWRQTPRNTMAALLQANGIKMPEKLIQPMPGMVLFHPLDTSDENK